MTQALQSPYAVPILQIVAGVAALQIINGTSPVTQFAAKKITEISEEFLEAARKVLFDSPVIAISAGLTYLVQEYTTHKIPSLSLSMPGCTSLQSTLCVAGILVVRSALSPYLGRVVNYRVLELAKTIGSAVKAQKYLQKAADKAKEAHDSNQIIGYLRGAVIRNAVPIAAACTAAYYAEVPVKLAQTALYTASLISMVTLLGKGLEQFVSVEGVKNTAEKVIGWIN